MHGVEFAGLTSAIAEASEHLKRFAIQDMNLFVRAVRQENVFLLRVFRERDVPDGSITEGLRIEDLLFYESSIGFEDLDTVVGAVADIQQAIIRQFSAMHGIAELLRGRIVGIVAPQRRVIGLVAVGAPVPFVLAGVGVEYDYAMIPLAIGNNELIGFGIDKEFGRAFEVFDVVAALALTRLADLH